MTDAMLPAVSLLLGLVFGSLAGAAAYRWPLGLGLLRPRRSVCPHCHHRLATADLIPVLSWLHRRGRCRYCRGRVSACYLLCELVTPVAFVAVSYWQGLTPSLPFHWALIWIAVVVTVSDWRWRIVPDQAVVVGLIAGLGLAVLNFSPARWYGPLLDFILPPLPLLAMALVVPGSIGGGDIKIAPVLGLFFGWAGGLTILAGGFVLAALLTWPLLVRKRHLTAHRRRLADVLAGRGRQQPAARPPTLQLMLIKLTWPVWRRLNRTYLNRLLRRRDYRHYLLSQPPVVAGWSFHPRDHRQLARIIHSLRQPPVTPVAMIPFFTASGLLWLLAAHL
ncbi:MAG: prepilin peptidase [Negativicutes bacterium]|nr:prepilin peptidase [Negativicutes bacterium]